MLNKATPADIGSLYLSGMSIPEVSEKTGIPLSTVRFRLLKKGILRSRAEGVRVAVKKGRLVPVGNKTKRSVATKMKISEAQKAIGNDRAIGFTYKPNGYMEFTRGPYKGRLVHVVIMEKAIGRKLRADEIVHHKDGVRSNNHILNLELMTRSSHASLHSIENNKKRSRNKKGQLA